MARHSHWHQIRQKKGAEDKKRGKIFTKHAKLIAIAVQKGGGDLEMNPSLRMAVENAKIDNLPKDNIDRAIKKGLGEGKENVQFSEVTYEGFGPGGTALMIEAVSNNTNRTLQSVRMILQENGGTLGASGSTSYLFEQKGILRVKSIARSAINPGDHDEDELKLIDNGAEDIQEIEGEYIVFCAPNKIHEAKKKIGGVGFEILSSELSFEPKTPVKIDPETQEKLGNLIDAIEEDEDVSRVSTNADFST